MAEYMEAWRLRLEALEALLGPKDPQVLTAAPPLNLGGGADVMTFRKYVPGLAHVTGGLTGVTGINPLPNQRGRTYELMICMPREEPWAAKLISQLARYTFDAALNPGETMDCPVFPGGRLKGLLFASPALRAPFQFGGTNFDLLLCLGITADELRRCRSKGSTGVVADLEARGVFPFTDVTRS